MKSFVYTFTLFGSMLFFCLAAIIGINYSGAESSNLYRYYSISFFVLSMILFIWDLSRMKVRPSFIFTGIVLVLIPIICIIEGFANSTTFLCFCAFCVPASCIAMVCTGINQKEQMIRWLDIVFLIITISLFFFIRKMAGSYSMGELYYSQRYSYYSGFAFNLDLYLLFLSVSDSRFRFTRSKLYRVICYVLLPLYPIVIFISGGRGGFVTLISGLIVLLLLNRKRFKYQSVLFLSVIFFIIIVAFLSSSNSILSQLYERNSQRILSVINSGAIDYSQSAGRDSIYKYCWELIKSQPVFGYGLLSYTNLLHDVPYAHNLFLEWLLQGGFLLFFILTFILVFTCCKYIRIIKHDKSSLFLLPCILYSFSELMFSSTYLEEPLFWFSAFYILNYHITK